MEPIVLEQLEEPQSNTFHILRNNHFCLRPSFFTQHIMIKRSEFKVSANTEALGHLDVIIHSHANEGWEFVTQSYMPILTTTMRAILVMKKIEPFT